jgi:hypothetical protein
MPRISRGGVTRRVGRGTPALNLNRPSLLQRVFKRRPAVAVLPTSPDPSPLAVLNNYDLYLAQLKEAVLQMMDYKMKLRNEEDSIHELLVKFDKKQIHPEDTEFINSLRKLYPPAPVSTNPLLASAQLFSRLYANYTQERDVKEKQMVKSKLSTLVKNILGSQQNRIALKTDVMLIPTYRKIHAFLKESLTGRVTLKMRGMSTPTPVQNSPNSQSPTSLTPVETSSQKLRRSFDMFHKDVMSAVLDDAAYVARARKSLRIYINNIIYTNNTIPGILHILNTVNDRHSAYDIMQHLQRTPNLWSMFPVTPAPSSSLPRYYDQHITHPETISMILRNIISYRQRLTASGVLGDWQRLVMDSDHDPTMNVLKYNLGGDYFVKIKDMQQPDEFYIIPMSDDQKYVLKVTYTSMDGYTYEYVLYKDNDPFYGDGPLVKGGLESIGRYALYTRSQ